MREFFIFWKILRTVKVVKKKTFLFPALQNLFSFISKYKYQHVSDNDPFLKSDGDAITFYQNGAIRPFIEQ